MNLNRLGFLLILVLFSCSQTKESVQAVAQLESGLAILELDQTRLLITEVASELREPWHITWGPDDYLWMTQHEGLVSRLDPSSGQRNVLLTIPDVHFQKSRGLLSMVLHPEFDTSPYVYLHYTFIDTLSQKEEDIRSRLVRYSYLAEDDTLVNRQILIDNIPGTTYHNGSRMLVTPDKKIILTTGDAGNLPGCQDPTILSGKTLRLKLDGSIPEDNPNSGSYVFSIGHRNPQGITFGNGKIYSSEHGPHNDDEVNIIEAGGNYGWPDVEGMCDKDQEKTFCEQHDISEPLITWSPTIAPAGIAYYDHPAIPEWQNSLLLVALKGRAFRSLTLDSSGEEITDEHIYLQRVYGRFRDLCVAPNGDVFLVTSNTDWHPQRQSWMYEDFPKPGSDKVLKLSPLPSHQPLPSDLLVLHQDSAQFPIYPENFKLSADVDHPGGQLYMENCAMCHLPDGKGVEGIPPLINSDWVVGDRKRLINAVLAGLSGEIEVNGEKYNQEMPGFGNSLNDQELASLLSFVRGYFGKVEGTIGPEEVAELRQLN